jgi:hypothetical protein
MHHVTHRHFSFFIFIGDNANSRSYYQNLVAGMSVPASGRPALEVHHAAIKVLAVAFRYCTSAILTTRIFASPRLF